MIIDPLSTALQLHTLTAFVATVAGRESHGNRNHVEHLYERQQPFICKTTSASQSLGNQDERNKCRDRCYVTVNGKPLCCTNIMGCSLWPCFGSQFNRWLVCASYEWKLKISLESYRNSSISIGRKKWEGFSLRPALNSVEYVSSAGGRHDQQQGPTGFSRTDSACSRLNCTCIAFSKKSPAFKEVIPLM